MSCVYTIVTQMHEDGCVATVQRQGTLPLRVFVIYKLGLEYVDI